MQHNETELRNAYERDGYLVLERFRSKADCATLRERMTQIIRTAANDHATSIFEADPKNHTCDDYFLGSGDKIHFFFEKDAFDASGNLRINREKEMLLNKAGHALHALDPIFKAFSHHASQVALVHALGLKNPQLLQSMYIFKQPGIGGEVPPHQDATFLYTEPSTVMGLWFALEDAGKDNGCLWAIPGGHKEPLKSKYVHKQTGAMAFETYDATPWDVSRMLPLEVPEGSLVVLNGLLPHMSYANRSDKTRHAYSIHLIDGQAHYPESNWLKRSHTCVNFI
jgi:phytanoyl-CoA hydroxylase